MTTTTATEWKREPLDNGEGVTLGCECCSDPQAFWWAVLVRPDGSVARGASGAMKEEPICDDCLAAGAEEFGIYVKLDDKRLLTAWVYDWAGMARAQLEARAAHAQALVDGPKDVARLDAMDACELLAPEMSVDRSDLASFKRLVWKRTWRQEQRKVMKTRA